MIHGAENEIYGPPPQKNIPDIVPGSGNPFDALFQQQQAPQQAQVAANPYYVLFEPTNSNEQSSANPYDQLFQDQQDSQRPPPSIRDIIPKCLTSKYDPSKPTLPLPTPPNANKANPFDVFFENPVGGNPQIDKAFDALFQTRSSSLHNCLDKQQGASLPRDDRSAAVDAAFDSLFRDRSINCCSEIDKTALAPASAPKTRRKV